MNVQDFYQRHMNRAVASDMSDTPIASAVEAAEVSAFAVHRDPSARQPSPQPDDSEKKRPTVAWVRPSDLVTTMGSAYVRRGIDLQAEVTRRARRIPARGAGRIQRTVTRAMIARTDQPTPSAEGLGL